MKLDSDKLLEAAIANALSGADPTTVQIITAVTGLLATVAYSDRSISPEESSHLRAELERINGLDKSSVSAICDVLTSHALRFSASFVQRFTRTLREELDEETRAEVLDALLGMAAADGVISFDEVATLRNVTTGLGLSQGHYNQLQTKHRDKLSLL
jgi:uncharacterized tellurite resistance protein B-like protein